MPVAIRTDKLTRQFGKRVAVDQLDLEVQQGEVFGFLGPNGAGKTTTIRLLNGILSIHAGSATVLGQDVATHAVDIRRRVGVLTENLSLYDSLSARENLDFVGNVFGIPSEALPGRINTVLAEFGLLERADDLVGSFSKGMRQRLGIAQVILHEPELVFLDEPTSGLDPEAARMVNELIQQLSHQGGRTVFLCTHNLDEAQRLCDRVGVIDQGKLQAVGTPAELADQLWQGLWVEVRLQAAPEAGLLELLHRLPIVTEANSEVDRVTCKVNAESAIPDLVIAISSAGGRILSVQPRQHTLSDIYFRIQHDTHQNGGAP